MGHILLMQLDADGRLGFSHLLAVMTSAAMAVFAVMVVV